MHCGPFQPMPLLHCAGPIHNDWWTWSMAWALVRVGLQVEWSLCLLSPSQQAREVGNSLIKHLTPLIFFFVPVIKLTRSESRKWVEFMFKLTMSSHGSLSLVEDSLLGPMSVPELGLGRIFHYKPLQNSSLGTEFIAHQVPDSRTPNFLVLSIASILPRF